MSRSVYSGYRKQRGEDNSRQGSITNEEARHLINLEKKFDYRHDLDYRIPAFGEEDARYRIVSEELDGKTEQRFTNVVEYNGMTEEEGKLSTSLIHDHSKTILARIDIGEDLPSHRNIRTNETLSEPHVHLYTMEDKDYAVKVSEVFPNLVLYNKVDVVKALLDYANVSLDGVQFEEKFI